MNSKLFILCLFTVFCFIKMSAQTQNIGNEFQNNKITVGAARMKAYIKKLKGKNVGLVINQTSVIGKNNTFLVDTLLASGIKVTAIFAPEHGFRGKADAGEHFDNQTDSATGVKIISIYGKKYAPDSSDLKDIDVLIFDIQDVGTRFYTYISTLQYVMEAAAVNKKPLIILDRPNPNGHYVDGPILDTAYKSFVGMQAVPIVYGMTIGEYALMLNGEKLLKNGIQADIFVVKCAGYNHKSFYSLPVKPSPNIPNMHAVYLYPSICLFEGTNISLGRGTDKQFQIYGSPRLFSDKFTFRFTPRPNEGAKKPPLENTLCNGIDLSVLPIKNLQQQRFINLSYITEAYADYAEKDTFFMKSNFFEKLAGIKLLREQIKSGENPENIRAQWQSGITNFKIVRKKYLLYRDFE